MKKKLFTLLTLLLCLCSGAWGQYSYNADTSVPEWTVNFNSWAAESDASSKTATTVHNPRLFWDTSGSTAKWNNHSVSTDLAFDADGFYYFYNPGTARQLPTDPDELAALCYVVYKGNGSSNNYPKYNNTSSTISAPSTSLNGLSNNSGYTSDAVMEIHAPRDGYVRMLLGTDANAEPSGGYSATLSGATTGTVSVNYLATDATYNVKTKDGSSFTTTTYTSAGKKLKSVEFAVNAGTTTITMNPAAMCNNTSTARKLFIYAIEMYLASAGDAITLDANGGTKVGSGTIPANATSFTPTAPEYAGHTVDGYYTTSACATMIATAAGALQQSISVGETAWTDADSKWVKGGAATFYAHWKVNTPEISCTNNVVTISVPTGSTVYYTDDGTTTPTSESTPYTEPFAITATKTIKAIAIQANCTNSEVATQECEFATPKYTISYNAGGGSGTMTATGNIEEGSSQAISANTFTRECYTFANWTANVDVTVGGATINAGDPIADEATIQNVTGDITLTAQWNIVYSSSADFNVYAYANLAYKAQSGTWTPLNDNNFAYSLYNDNNNKTSLDHSENAPYVGLKIKNSSDYIKFAVPAGKQVTVIFGYVKDAKPKLSIDGGAETDINITLASDNQIVYYAQENADRIFKIKPGNSNATVIKKIFIEDASTEKVTATVGANGYTTFASPYALDLTDANRPAGLKAYKATRDGANLTFEELHQTVPAGTGLLLLGETKGGNYDIPVVAGAGTAAVSNALIGITAVTAMKSTADDNYFFVMRKAADESSALSFAPLATTAVNVPAGKVVIEVPNSAFPTTGSARELTYSFEKGNTTGINTLDNLTNSQFDNDAPMYNLAGQKVGKSYKGIVIVNGKKFMNK